MKQKIKNKYICHFGKYDGTLWSDIPTDYIFWILSNYRTFDTLAVTSAEAQITIRKSTDVRLTKCFVGKKYKDVPWEDVPQSYLKWIARQTRISPLVKDISLYLLNKKDIASFISIKLSRAAVPKRLSGYSRDLRGFSQNRYGGHQTQNLRSYGRSFGPAGKCKEYSNEEVQKWALDNGYTVSKSRSGN